VSTTVTQTFGNPVATTASGKKIVPTDDPVL
jgi:hypothetical protein